MKRTLYIITLTLYLTALMALGRLAFLVYNRDVEFFTLRDVLECEWHALPFDLSVVAVMVIPVWLLTALTLKCAGWRDHISRWWCLPRRVSRRARLLCTRTGSSCSTPRCSAICLRLAMRGRVHRCGTSCRGWVWGCLVPYCSAWWRY